MEFLLPLLVGFIAFMAVLVVLSVFGEVASEEYEMAQSEEEVENVFVNILLPVARIAAKGLRPFFREMDQTIIFREDRSFNITEYWFRFTSWWREKVQRLLIRAGQQDAFDPMEIIGLQFVGLIIGGGLGYGMYTQYPKSWLLVAMFFIGFFLPIISLKDQASRRLFEVRIMLPYVLDLLTLSVEAGLDFTAALQRIAEKGSDNPLIDEMKRMLQQIQLGKPRSEALREMSDRIDLEELGSVIQALIQADELGSPLGPVLRIQAEQLRVKRAQRAEKLAQEAPVKMLLPLIGCIFPTVFIVLFGPIAIGILQRFW